jgi:hypothetical protein
VSAEPVLGRGVVAVVALGDRAVRGVNFGRAKLDVHMRGEPVPGASCVDNPGEWRRAKLTLVDGVFEARQSLD